MKQSYRWIKKSILFLSLSPFSVVSATEFVAADDSFSWLPNRNVIRIQEQGLPIWSVQPADLLPDGQPNDALNHFSDRPEGFTPQALVMHYTVCDFESTLRLFAESPREVSAHYVISENQEGVVSGGTVVQVVPEDKRAWHAGPSEWRGILCDTRDGKSRGLNSASIGIENVNKGFTEAGGVITWYPFDSRQIHALGQLSAGIVARWGIHPTNVVGHSDIQVGVKSDPGVLFPWGELYHKYGIGAWLTPAELVGRFSEGAIERQPLPQGVSEAYFLHRLKEYGYTGVPDGSGEITPELVKFLRAFRMHFSANQQPDKLDGPLREEDMAWIHSLTTKYPREISASL
jgi:N-acetylmuramoyl-L-alanine amidase